MGKSKMGAAYALLFLVWSLGSTSSPYAQSNFYQGKSIRVVRGGQVGDLYDLWARLIAGHLGKHIPGNPSIGSEYAGGGLGDRGKLCLWPR